MFKFDRTNQQLQFTQPLSHDSISEIDTHTVYKQGHEEAHFDTVSTNYDAILKLVGYPDPQ